MRPLSKVETRRGGSIPSRTLYLFHSPCLRCFVFSAALRNFHNWTFTLKEPDGCAATSFGMPLLSLPLLVCLCFRYLFWYAFVAATSFGISLLPLPHFVCFCFRYLFWYAFVVEIFSMLTISLEEWNDLN